MPSYCTILDSASLAQGRCLLQSLSPHIGDRTFYVLCLDDASEHALHDLTSASLRVLSLADLLAAHPSLTPAQHDRTPSEFLLTCKSWLLHHLLPQLAPGELLTYLHASLYFYSSPAPVEQEIGAASIAIVPRRLDTQLAHLERQGKYSTAWITFRNDETGRACAAWWAQQCAEWCFSFCEADRYADQKYLDACHRRFPGTLSLTHPGVAAAAGNVGDRPPVTGPTGLLIERQPLICFDFASLVHLGEQLYDSGFHHHEIKLGDILRRDIYLPYLRQLVGEATPPPDIVPPSDPLDVRCGTVLSQLWSQLQQAELALAAAKLTLEKERLSSRLLVDELLAREREQARYTQQVEQERNEQRQDFFDTRDKLEAFHLDLMRNVSYVKKLEAEADAHRKVAIERETYINNLKEQLAARQTGAERPDPTKLHLAWETHIGAIRRLLIARYNPNLLPTILTLSAQGVSIEVLDSPPELVSTTSGGVHYLRGSLWEWLGGLNSVFDDAAYLAANPDIAGAVASGDFPSGWDHYQRFGQHEGRSSGTPNYRSGLTDFDAVAFDSSDAGPLVPCMIGRLQSYHKLIISSSFNPPTVWLPIDAPREIVLDDLLVCPSPPISWLGPRLPSALPVGHRSKSAPVEFYPAAPAQQAVWPKITVVTTNHNQSSGLAKTIRSVLTQHYPNLEYIVVDRGSTDDSCAIIRQHADQLTWWISETDSGPAQAMNKGLAKSTGSLLVWLDAGDQLTPGSLFTVAQQSLLHDADLFAGRCVLDRSIGIEPQIHRSVLALGQVQPLPLTELADLERCWLNGWFFARPEVFFRRRIFDRVGAQVSENLQHCADYDLWLRMARAGATILPIPEILARYLAPAQSRSPAALQEMHAVSTSFLSPA
ncbi:MAG: glycosyltransferase [Cephaloticoccus sp.]|nr:glycosyltransferase [Cephaloticoccus sp.]MCF7760773.1 glycosyltransferase [Cephaloticoccus sp.]